MKLFNKIKLAADGISIVNENENSFTLSKNGNSLTFDRGEDGYYSINLDIFEESMLDETEVVSIVINEDLLERINTH